jgi:IrrE N-terminal-like domain
MMVLSAEHVFERPIGAIRGKRSADEVIGGSARGMSFLLRWSDPTSAEGDLTISLGGNQVWTTAPQTLASSAWVEFLAGLSSAWLHLRLEETYPRGVVPEMPSRTEAALLSRVISPEATGEEFRLFRRHHDISAWFKSDANFPPMWMIREGNLMLMEGGNRILRWAYSDVIRTLQHLGTAIAERLSAASDASAVAALRSWQMREQAADSDLDKISLGITTERLSHLAQIVPLRTRAQIFGGVDEVRAAARMLLSWVDDDVVLKVAELIRSQPRRDTPELSKLTVQAAEILTEASRELPRIQGRQVAIWFRNLLNGVDQTHRVNPEKLLKSWNVAIVPFTTVAQMEAISFWGPSHGPAILLNIGGRRSRQSGGSRHGTSGGARFTLAHELCHLLLDTEGSLPVAEVLGGSVPNAPEERANAFAAEFLLPESVAGRAYTESATVDEALRSLTRTYGVTKTLAGWQILKRFGEGSPVLSQSDFLALRQITGVRRAA